jgi:hypothetical protein
MIESQSAVHTAHDDAVKLALEWCNAFLARPHPTIGRNGHVCPFLEAATRADTLRVDSRPLDGAEVSAAKLDALVDEMLDVFRTAVWPHPNEVLHALVMVLPRLPTECWHLLDELQARAKPQLADRFLMMGQFHPNCVETAARNPEFFVSRSPVPMLALRNMAFHDILFLDSDAHTFAAYSRKFGARYTTSAAFDPLFRQRYECARQRFGAAM